MLRPHSPTGDTPTVLASVTAATSRLVSRLRRLPRRVVVAGQLLALGLVVWLVVVPQVHRSGASLNLMFDFDSIWLPLALLAELVSLGSYALTTRSMLPPKARPSLLRVLRIDLSAIALGHCLPDGGAAGTALSWRLLVAAGVPSGEAMFAKLAQGVVAAAVLQVLLLGAFGVGLVTGGVKAWNAIPAAVSVVVLVVLAALILAMRRPGAKAAIERTAHRIPRYGARIAISVGRAYQRFVQVQLRDTFAHPRQAAQTAAFAAANWLFDAAALWAAVSAYGRPIALEGVAAAIAIQVFASWLPITPSGLGLSDGLMIPALVAFGATPAAAVLGVLTWRVISYWLPMPLGSIAYGSLLLTHRTERRAGACRTA